MMGKTPIPTLSRPDIPYQEGHANGKKGSYDIENTPIEFHPSPKAEEKRHGKDQKIDD
jgi:hypothetical protein